MIRKIEEIFEKEIMGEKREQLEKFRLLLLEYNQKYNLTAILEEKDVYHVFPLIIAYRTHNFVLDSH